MKDTYEMQIKQLETQIQLLKNQNKLDEEALDKLRAQAYKEKMQSQEEIQRVKAKIQKPCQECAQMRESIEEMS